MQSRCLQQNKGSLLLEVMLALAIVSVALVGLIRSFSLMAGAEVKVRHLTTAVYLIQQKQHDIEQAPLLNREQSGVFDPPFADFRWQVRPQPEAGAQKMTLTVSWTEGGQEKNFSVTTLYRPVKADDRT